MVLSGSMSIHDRFELAIFPLDKDVLDATISSYRSGNPFKQLHAKTFFGTYIELLAEKEGKSISKMHINQLWEDSSDGVKAQYRKHA